MDLKQALRADSKIRLALVGSGGKTTAMFQLARQLTGPVMTTSSTHLAREQLTLADRHWRIYQAEQIDDLTEAILTAPISLFHGSEIGEDRVEGEKPDVLDALLHFADQQDLPLLIEADGSRRLPIKAPAEHEPAIPPWVNTVVVMVGFSAFGNPISEENVHRLDRFCALAHLSAGDRLTGEGLVSYLLHPLGGLKNIPQAARKIVLLNQVDSAEQEASAHPIAKVLISTYDAVITASLSRQVIHAAYEQTAGVILAAGASQRFGKAKVLEEWQGVSFVRRVAETAIKGGLSPIVVVTGELDKEIRLSLAGLPIQIVKNLKWREGQSTSVQAGLKALEGRAKSAIFLLADQPQVPASILSQLTDLHSRTLAPAIAPQVMGRRANPVLFDQVTFSDLNRLVGDVGGRAIFDRYPITFLPSKDERLLLDIDTPDDYNRLKELSAGEE
jgi:molybdenum cofactor cytidylyltransferase